MTKAQEVELRRLLNMYAAALVAMTAGLYVRSTSVVAQETLDHACVMASAELSSYITSLVQS